MKSLLFFAIFGISVVSAAISSSTSFNVAINAIFSKKECDDYLFANIDEAPVDRARNCGGKKCDWPQEVCFVRSMLSLNDMEAEEFHCRAVPPVCYAAIGGTGSPKTSPKPKPPTKAPTPKPSGNVCSMPKYTGLGCYRAKKKQDSSFKLRSKIVYFYHKQSKTCKRMRAYNCGNVNGNRFSNLNQCKSTCVAAPTSSPTCDAKYRQRTGKFCPGKPRKYLRRYSFDPNTKKCRRTYYRGCNGGSHLFNTAALCTASCKA